MTDLALAENFKAPSYDEWRKLAEDTLKGADFEKRLVSTTYDGLKLQPVYGQSEGVAIPAKAESGWAILQRVDMPDVTDANAQALRDLEAGASGLTIVIDGHGGPSGFGVKASTIDDFERLLEGIYLEMIPLRLDAGSHSEAASAELIKLYEKRGIDVAAADLTLGGYQANGRIYHNAGASEAQELAAALASAVAGLRRLETGGLDLKSAMSRISMVLTTDADMFLSAAKLRAARLLWNRVQEASGLEPAPLKLHAESSWRMMSKRDPHVNLLRATAATFAAATGGADSLTVLPFTSAVGLPDRFGRRMARNVQLVLSEECRLGHVQDPAAGSGFMDETTLELAGEAWKQFQAIEAVGGLDAALDSGTLQKQISETKAQRLRNIARRKDTLTGVSEFPHLDEAPADVLAPLEQISSDDNGLAPFRLSEPFEVLRDASDAQSKRSAIFLANLGTPADFTVRATWAGNLFESGGIEAAQNDGFESIEDAVTSFKASGAKIVAICSSDAIYGEMAAGAAQALKKAGAERIYLAGRPHDDLSAAGVGSFVYAGCDILTVLQDAHKLLGVSS